MTDRMVATILVAISSPLAAQWLNYPTPGTPRTKDGKANLSAPTPRASNGKPDLSGIWEADPSPEAELKALLGDLDAVGTAGVDARKFSKYVSNILADFKPGEEPIRSEAAALLKQRMATMGKDIPTSHCLPGGVPFSTLIGPFKFVQAPGVIVMLLDDNNPPRQIYTDGRKLPADPWPSWMGYSSGKWEGDTLVVDTMGFNDRSWLDGVGHPRSEAMHIVERFRRRDFGHLDVQMTFDDPKMYTKPFSIKFREHLLPDTDVLESICAENERDRSHLQ